MKAITFAILFCATAAFCADYEILDRSLTITIHSNAFATEKHREVVRILTENGTGYQTLLPVNSYIKVRNIVGNVSFPNGKLEKIKEEGGK